MNIFKKNSIINSIKYNKKIDNWDKALPFPHLVIDNFFKIKVAKELEKEFPKYNNNIWSIYKNKIELKKVCNNWNLFPKKTYQVFTFLNSKEFISKISKLLLNSTTLYADQGLNGGGWHIHSKGGKLNTHLDYSLHPKLKLQRYLNLIIYLNSNWRKSWGGDLGLWDNKSEKKPGNLIKQVFPKFNRAIIFDTTKNSWHGLPDPIKCPKNEFRKSIAVYYLRKPKKKIDKRGKALFYPSKDQEGDPKIKDLIKRRSDLKFAYKVYGD